MSYFIVVTYDLHAAHQTLHGRYVYSKLRTAFKKIDFSQHIIGRKQVKRKLPANVFLAEFEVETYKHSKELAEYVKKEIRSIFKAYKVHGHYFVSVGRQWAWVTGRV